MQDSCGSAPSGLPQPCCRAMPRYSRQDRAPFRPIPSPASSDDVEKASIRYDGERVVPGSTIGSSHMTKPDQMIDRETRRKPG